MASLRAKVAGTKNPYIMHSTEKAAEALLKIGRWLIGLALLAVATWAAVLGYMAEGWLDQWPGEQAAVARKMSLATAATAMNWWVVWLFSAISLGCAFVVVRRREVPLVFAAMVACVMWLFAGVLDVMVVSAGFEITGFTGR